MKFSPPVNKAELFWWLLLVVWGLLVVFWQPPRPMVLTDAASYGFTESDFRVFYDLVSKEVASTERYVDPSKPLPEDAEVLVIISPSGPLTIEDRAYLWEWVGLGPRALVLVHPFYDDNGEFIDRFWALSDRNVSSFSLSDEYLEVETLEFTGFASTSARKVPALDTVSTGTLEAAGHSTVIFLEDKQKRVYGTMDWVGPGRVLQIATGAVLDNQALGTKTSHLLAAALIDEIGRDYHWIFDESHNDIQTRPAVFQLIASSPLRPVLLHVFFLMIFLYWWKSSRLGKRRVQATGTRTREVTTLARDIGLFYHRARKSDWGLAQMSAYLKYKVRQQGLRKEDTVRAEALVNKANELLKTYEFDPKESENVALMKKIAALCYRVETIKKRKH